MKKIFMLIAVLVSTIVAHAQLRERVVVRAGENIPNAVSPNGYFRFPKFAEGVLLMQDGRRSTSVFNYHLVTGEMLFINNGDTMAIGVPEEMDQVVVAGNSHFIYKDKSYLEILSEGESVRLAKKVKVTMENDKNGGFGQSALNSSNDQLAIHTNGKLYYELTYDVAVIKVTSFFWVNGKDNLQPVTKRSSLRLVPKEKQSRLEAFIEENKTNFNSEEDLRRLLAFADSL